MVLRTNYQSPNCSYSVKFSNFAPDFFTINIKSNFIIKKLN